MATTIVTSKFLNISLRDFWRGLVIALITPIFTIIISSLVKHTLDFDWYMIGATALTTALAYYTKHLAEPSKTIVILEPPLPDTAAVPPLP